MAYDHEFELTDAEGKRHTYKVELHPGGEGYALSLELTRLGLPLLGKAVTLLEGGDEDDIDIDAATEVAAKVLGSIDGPELTRRILKHTLRDDVPVEAVFDTFARGNYAEVYQAIGQVIAANRFFPVPTTFGLVGTSLAAKG